MNLDHGEPVSFIYQMLSVLILQIGFGIAYFQINSETPRELSLELWTTTDNTLHTVVVLYREQSMVSFPTLELSGLHPITQGQEG